MVSLETDRLVIRNFRPEDWQELRELAIAYQASEEAKFEPPWPTAEEEVRGMAAWFAGGDGYLAVWLKEIGKLIGMIAIESREGQGQRIHNLGYVFHPGYQGRGYATEGCRAAMAYVFGPLAADRILTGTHPDNKPSVALLNRLGLRAVGDGEWTISKEEWLAQQVSLDIPAGEGNDG